MKRNLMLFAIVLVAMLLGTVVMFNLCRPYLRARTLLSRISTFQIGKTTFEEAQRVGKELGSTGNEPCTPEDCYWTFSVDNFKIPALWRGEGERFIAGFRVQSSVVSEQHFMFQIGTGYNAQTADFWERESWPHFAKPFVVGTQSAPSSPHYRSYVKLTPATPPVVRERYLAFDLNCLWKFHGCTDARELLPTVDWQ
jgi:hypothetical protein